MRDEDIDTFGSVSFDGAAAGRTGRAPLSGRRQPIDTGEFVDDSDSDQNRASALTTRVRSGISAEGEFGHGFLWLAVAFGLGAAAYSTAPREFAMAAIAVPLVLLSTALILARRRESAWSWALLAGVLFFAGVAAGKVEAVRHMTTLIDGTVTTTVQGRVLAREVNADGHPRYTIEITETDDPRIGRPPEIVRLVARGRHEPIAIGEAIAGRARLSPPSGPVMPGGYDFAFSSYFQGVGAIGFFYGAPEVPPGGDDGGVRLADRVAAFRAAIGERIRDRVSGDKGALAAALTVGDRRAISDETVENLRATGLAHILAISGLHMALAAGSVLVLLRFGLALFPGFSQAFATKKIAAAGAILAATGYLVMSGAPISAQRAWLMFAIMLGAVLLDRPALTLRNVALAAFAIIAITPSAVVSPGFQMSFAATAALISAYALLSERSFRSARDNSGQGGLLRRTLLFVGGLALTSLIAGLATGLFSAYHFHRLAAFGLFANLLAVPLVTFVVMPAGLVAMILMPYGIEGPALDVMGMGLAGVMAVASHLRPVSGDVTTGQIALLPAAVATAGFLVLVLMRSRLRWAGLPLMTIGVALAALPLSSPKPEILVSEDGRLVALSAEGGLAANRKRPASFVMDQWQRAMRASAVYKPADIDAGTDLESAADDMAESMASMKPGRFACAPKAWCGAVHPRGGRVITVEDAAYLGAACDNADLVITPLRLRMERCWSGARLMTANTLRRTGSMAIRFEADDSGAAGPGRALRIAVEPALSPHPRPWTVHRFYDWRDRAFAEAVEGPVALFAHAPEPIAPKPVKDDGKPKDALPAQ